MFDRMSNLVGAGVVTAGVSAAMFSGTGVALAATEPGAGGDTPTSDSSGAGTRHGPSRTRPRPTAT